MNRRELVVGTLAAGGLSALAPARALATRAGALPLGTRVEWPSARLIDGRVLGPDHWKGKVVVIELWATWCPFCAKQNPHLDALHRRFAGKGLEVLTLSIDRTSQAAADYVQKRGYAFHVAMYDEEWGLALGRPAGLPVVWVVGADARLKQIEIGEMFPEDIEALARWRDA